MKSRDQTPALVAKGVARCKNVWRVEVMVYTSNKGAIGGARLEERKEAEDGTRAKGVGGSKRVTS